MSGAFAPRLSGEPAEALARVVHDLHGPLTVIRGLCATLSRGEVRPEHRRAIDLIDAETLRLAAGLKGLERASTRRSARAPVDLVALAARAIERFSPIAAGHGLRLSTGGAQVRIWIQGDSVLLERLIENLIQNALRHCAAAGTVRVLLAVRSGRAVLRVCDDGPGVPPGDRERIFRAGERGSAPRGEGRGLGLAIARDIAESHGGGLTLDAVGVGTCFRLSLPLGQASDDGPRAA